MLTASGKRSVSGRPMTTDNTADGSQQRHCSHCSRAVRSDWDASYHPLLAALKRFVPISCGRLLVATTAGVCNDRYHYNNYVGEFGNRAATTLRIQSTRRTHATIQKTLIGHFRWIRPRQNSPAQLLHNCRPARIPYTDRPCAHQRSYMERHTAALCLRLQSTCAIVISTTQCRTTHDAPWRTACFHCANGPAGHSRYMIVSRFRVAQLNTPTQPS